MSPLPRSLARTDEPLSAVFALVEPVSFIAVGTIVRLTVAVVLWPAASVAV